MHTKFVIRNDVVRGVPTATPVVIMDHKGTGSSGFQNIYRQRHRQRKSAYRFITRDDTLSHANDTSVEWPQHIGGEAGGCHATVLLRQTTVFRA
ncbi:MAG: hypothetical protein GY880_08005 [Planctomycetaceae bacterium]|nr:hypothetical protein [Planctomycetaceae bacterium]